MTKNDFKKELLDEVQRAIGEYLRSTRGSNAAGSRATITRLSKNVIQVQTSSAVFGGQRGPSYFNVTVSEKM